MSVQVALTFPDFAAAQAFFAGLGTSTTVVRGHSSLFEAAPAPVVAETAPAAAPVEPAKPPKAAKPPKKAPAAEPVAPLDVAKGDELPAAMQAPAADPLEVPAFLDRRTEAAPAKVWTIEAVREELQKVSAKHGIDAVRAIVVEFGGTNRISEVPEAKYAAVAEAAIAKVAA
jgi:hypothetical protein